MTENQEKELFNILGNLVTEVRGLGNLVIEVREIREDIHEIKTVQKEHSQILKRLDAKTDSIAETVMNNDKRLANVEKEIEDLRDGIH